MPQHTCNCGQRDQLEQGATRSSQDVEDVDRWRVRQRLVLQPNLGRHSEERQHGVCRRL
jgi:hypothetical protein